jgi:hypothetical protein
MQGGPSCFVIGGSIDQYDVMRRSAASAVTRAGFEQIPTLDGEAHMVTCDPCPLARE